MRGMEPSYEKVEGEKEVKGIKVVLLHPWKATK